MNNKDSRRQISNAIIVYLIGLLGWIILVCYREIKKSDINFLRSNIIWHCNGWCIGHFIHYLILGYLAPNYIWMLALIGFMFELIEIPLNNISKYIDGKLIQDTFVNIIGLIFGYLLFKIFPKRIYLYK